MLRTAWGFLFEPRAFDAQCDESARSDGTHGMLPYARPLTYLTASFLVCVAALYLYSSVFVVLPEFEAVARYLSSLDVTKLLAITFPVVATVASYAGMGSALARLTGCDPLYLLHLSIASYCVGTLLLAIPVFLLVLPLFGEPMTLGALELLLTLAQVVFGLALLTLICRAVYRYLAMLRRLVAPGWIRAFALASSALLSFLVLSWALVYAVRTGLQGPG